MEKLLKNNKILFITLIIFLVLSISSVYANARNITTYWRDTSDLNKIWFVDNFTSAGIRGYYVTNLSSYVPTNTTFLTPISYYPFENVSKDFINTYDANATTATLWTNSSCNFGRCYSFDGTTNYISISNAPSLNITGTGLTLSAWIKADTIGGTRRIVGMSRDGVAGTLKYHLLIETGRVQIVVANISTSRTADTPFTDTASWHHIVGIYNGSNLSIYLDGVRKNVTKMKGNIIGSTNKGGVNIGRFSASFPQLYDGRIDEVLIYNRALTSLEVKKLYNFSKYKNQSSSKRVINSNILEYNITTNSTVKKNQLVFLENVYLTGTIRITSNYTTITAKDYYNSSSFSSFYLKVQNSTTTQTYTTSTGTIITPISWSDTRHYNLTVYKSGGNYFNTTYLNYNGSQIDALGARLIRNYIYIRARNKTNNGVINTFNVTLNGTTHGTTNGTLRLILPNAKVNISVFGNIYMTRTYFNRNTSANITANLSYMWNKVYFNDSGHGIWIANATVTIDYPSGARLVNVTNSSGCIRFPSKYLGIEEIGNYIITLNTTIGYATPISFIKFLNATYIPANITYNISIANIIINFYYRNNHSIFLRTAHAYLLYFSNYTTNTGQIKSNITLVIGNYSVQAISNGFVTEQKTLVYSGTSNITLDFYLLNETQVNAGVLYVSTIDVFYRKIMGAVDSLLEYDPISLDFIEVSQCISNSNGECTFSIELGTKTYYIIASKTINGILYSAQTNPSGELILTDEEVRELVLYYTNQFEPMDIEFVYTSISESFVSNTSNINVSFLTTDGIPRTICVEYFESMLSLITSVTGYTYCLLSDNAILTASLGLNRSKTYFAEVYLNLSSGKVIIATFPYYSILSSAEEEFDDYFIGAIILSAWAITLGTAYFLKNISLFGYVGLFLTWIEVGLFPSYSIIELTVFKTIICIIVLWTARKTQET